MYPCQKVPVTHYGGLFCSMVWSWTSAASCWQNNTTQFSEKFWKQLKIKLCYFVNRWRYLSNFKPSSKKDLRNVSLVPVGKEKTTMNFLFALMCRCLKLQKSLFLQLLITKFGIMMGTARDETDLFSSISSIFINSIWLDLLWRSDVLDTLLDLSSSSRPIVFSRWFCHRWLPSMSTYS